MYYPEIKAPPKKVKRNRHKTACAVVRKTGCGCCGSQNTAEQGVVFCTVCGAEKEYLTQGSLWYRSGVWSGLCACEDRYGRKRAIGVGKCLDCGAVESDVLCPNHGNGRGHKCWKHWSGAVYCQSCGYRRSAP